MQRSSQVIHSKIRGVTQTNENGTDRQRIIQRKVKAGQSLKAIPEPRNPYDSNAVGLWVRRWFRSWQVGYLSVDLAKDLKGKTFTVKVAEVTGGGEGRSLGVYIEIGVRRRKTL